jgi:Sugar diacid utilization regulator
MNFTVEEALSIYPLSEGKIVAGHHGLGNEVKSITVLEIPEDPTFIKSGELCISTFYSIADSESAQMEVISMLKSRSASGLMLFNVGTFIKTISKNIMDLCDNLNFPLIVIPHTISYIEIMSPVLDRLLQIQNQKLKHSMQIYDKMSSLMLEERDFEEIILALSNIVNRQVLFFSHNNKAISNSYSSIKPELYYYIRDNILTLQSKFIAEKQDITIPAFDDHGAILLAPVVSSMMYYGVVVVIGTENLRDLDEIAIAQTKNAIGIISLNKINLKDYNILLRNDYINDLITGNFADDDTIVRRGLSLGFDVSKIKAAMILDIFNFSELKSNFSEADLQKLKSDFYYTVENEINFISPESILMNFSDKVLILFSYDKNSEDTFKRLINIGKHIAQVVKRIHSLEISIGIGSYCNSIFNIKMSYQQALLTVGIIHQLFKSPKCICFNDIQLFALLYENLDAQKTRMLVNNLLSPLITYDNENNSQLLPTFRMLLSNNMETAIVAEKLFLHKNTVLQRKKKISELLSLDPFSHPYRLQFELAVVLDDFFNTPNQTG